MLNDWNKSIGFQPYVCDMTCMQKTLGNQYGELKLYQTAE